MEEDLEDEQTFKPKPGFFNTLDWGKYVDMSSESLGDL